MNPRMARNLRAAAGIGRRRVAMPTRSNFYAAHANGMRRGRMGAGVRNHIYARRQAANAARSMPRAAAIQPRILPPPPAPSRAAKWGTNAAKWVRNHKVGVASGAIATGVIAAGVTNTGRPADKVVGRPMGMYQF